MPNENSPYACCTLPNDDEWHLPFRRALVNGALVTLITLPWEKLMTAGYEAVQAEFKLKALRAHGRLGNFRIGPFYFKDVYLPSEK